jgi:hypothetical protein
MVGLVLLNLKSLEVQDKPVNAGKTGQRTPLSEAALKLSSQLHSILDHSHGRQRLNCSIYRQLKQRKSGGKEAVSFCMAGLRMPAMVAGVKTGHPFSLR